ncbi:blastoderm-specific protein 25D isoform X2 [Ctenocephalides felis]|uniref:blastoderm-specific protein 25D isoform X2 n=1 Tax=Ctenocephalides felis TaxID=7515 RepID=UPI000E6E50BC|nr:blastoderm-specific protein 25D isoform X2 [Ctenocephalides felis]
MELSIDPYEQQLLNVFTSHDLSKSGTLDREALTSLCNNLQLEDREFKEGLLAILSADTKREDQHLLEDSGKESDREVSPKLILGSKKYGRRSKPQNFDNENLKSDERYQQNKIDYDIKFDQKVKRSMSQSEVCGSNNHSVKLKRCASLPTYKSANKDLSNIEQPISEEEIICLRDTWQRLGVGLDGYLTQIEFEKVWECIGLHKSAIDIVTQQFENLDTDNDGRISFEEFLLLFKHNSDYPCENMSLSKIDDGLELDSGCPMDDMNFGAPTIMWPNSAGVITNREIVDIWKNAGVSNPDVLLQDLGFDCSEVQVAELGNVLEYEIREVQNLNLGMHPHNPLLSLLQASLALKRAELEALRQAFKQIIDESKKLKVDNRDANHRAALLAQEVDEHHANLESSARNQMQQLEQKHSETLRDLMNQLSTERETWASTTMKLEAKIEKLEMEENKLRSDLEKARTENSNMESEQRNLQERIVELEESRVCILKELKCLQGEKETNIDKTCEEKLQEISTLLEQVSSLQVENTNLRDRNDELCVEVENLSSELSALKIKKSVYNENCMKQDTSLNDLENSDHSMAIAMKRRGDSPSKTNIADESSPRLGKLRKCSKENEQESKMWMQLDHELDHSSLTEIEKSMLQQKVKLSECVGAELEEVSQLKARVKDLVNQLNKIEENNELADLKTEHETCIKEKKQLQEQCNELEASLELLRTEYERCEDYWASKLDEERQIYDQEQRLNDEKFAELLKKMSEYEEQFGTTGRLSPIEERCQLEQQFADLENEYEEYRSNMELELETRNEEINTLKEKLNILTNLEKVSKDKEVENIKTVDEKSDTTNGVSDSASSSISYLCHRGNDNVNGLKITRDYQNPNFAWQNQQYTSNEQNIWKTESPEQQEKNDHKTFIMTCENLELSQDVTDNATTNSPNSTLLCADITGQDVKRLKLQHTQFNEELKTLQLQKEVLMGDIHMLLSSKINAEQNLFALQQRSSSSMSRVQQLEQRCRHLQNVLRQQQQYSESVLQQCWQQSRAEVADLHHRIDIQSRICAEQQSRLIQNDMLAKEMYCENAQLTATVQKLEQKLRHISRNGTGSQ